ncbi:glycosyl hydrolase family 43 [Kineosporia sp. NBRC 101677]|uniref:family 43 glycosylhydrolase n=1 Tax=Kineosporia sp. NBRC 101677 TaxID=3032197 RepID=UPI0024A16FD8|nr:family 43 glycosylhydrolase [Kineosporia sp. NBRC 101677]GLY18926.1 glycosyl hydrolase family 43 [Kineosporia sp. NBRC 101677]
MTEQQRTIRPGQPWLDTDGKRIQAHGGSIITVDGVFYWYGENKEATTPDSDTWHLGVRCYSSTDLCTWQDLGCIIEPDRDDPDSPLHPQQYADRPHIVYNERTRRFVCWIKVMTKGSMMQRSTVLSAPSILGPYRVERTWLRPLGMDAGDFDLVVDPHDGKAYYYFERVHSELICADLTDDYTDVTGYYSTHFPNGQPPFVREAPSYFYRRGLHYLVTSGTTGYYPNPSEVACARSYHGPWQVLGDPHPDDASRTSYHSQISSVFRHPFKKDLYIALGDRWLPQYTADSSAAVEAFTRHFSPETPDHAAPMPELTEINTSIADYVWLPFRFDRDRPYLDWSDEWSPDSYA